MICRKTLVLLHSVGICITLICCFTVTNSKAGLENELTPGEANEMVARVEKELTPLVVVTNRQVRNFSLVERMKYYNVPGVSIAVIQGGELAWTRGFGVADIETDRLVDAETLFRACSISKPVAAAAALCLVDRGIFGLDNSANKQLNAWKIPDSELAVGNTVTLRQLLSHSAGISDDPNLSYQHDQTIPTMIQVLGGTAPAKTAPVQINGIPGANVKYSNQGYCIVQLMMTDAVGESFAELTDKLVLGPAGMFASTYNQYPQDKFLDRYSYGYRSTGEGLQGKRLITPALAAAGLWSTSSDLARFAVAVMRSFNGAENAMLSRKTATEMLTLQVGERSLGFSLEGGGDDLCFSHGGASAGYRCFMLGYPARGEGAVVMTNSDSGQGLYYEIIRSIAAELDWSNYRPIEKTVVSLKQDHMREFEGVYELEGRLELRMNVVEDHLQMESPGNSFRLFPESDTKFFDIDYGFTIDFVKSDAGLITEAIMDRGGVLSSLVRTE